jgi:hypothetical protein
MSILCVACRPEYRKKYTTSHLVTMLTQSYSVLPNFFLLDYLAPYVYYSCILDIKVTC